MAIAKKTRKKNWYQILAPDLFNKQAVGEMYVSEPQKAVGRFVTVNLMALINDPKRQNINVKFKITSFRDNKFFSELISYQMSPSSIKRLVRRGRDKVDDSFLCKTSDNKIVRLKTLFLTSSNTKNHVLTILRKESRKLLIDYFSKRTFDNLFSEVISYKIQSQLKKALKKVYPLKICDMRSLELSTGKTKYREQPIKTELKKTEPKEEKMVQENVKGEKTEPKEEKPELKEAESEPKEKPAHKKESKPKKPKEDKNV